MPEFEIPLIIAGDLVGQKVGTFLGKVAGKIGAKVTNDFLEKRVIDPSAKYIFNKTFIKTLISKAKTMVNLTVKLIIPPGLKGWYTLYQAGKVGYKILKGDLAKGKECFDCISNKHLFTYNSYWCLLD